METRFVEQVLNPARLAALRRMGLLDTPAEAAFDRLADLAAKFLQTPVALVTLVDDTRQFFKSCHGLPEPWASWRRTPLSHSFCQHVVATSEPLVISDARVHPVFRDNLAIQDLGVIAYLGIPLKLSSGEVLGSFCVIDHQPRVWTNEDREILTALTACAITEIELRTEVQHRKQATQQMEDLNCQLGRRTEALEAANRDLQIYSSTISHDVKAPLARLVTLCDLVQEDCSAQLGEECSSLLKAVQSTAHSTRDVINGLAVLTGLARQTIEPSRVNLSEIAQDVVAELRSREPQRNATIEIQNGIEVDADEQLMRVLMENLIGNAWKFTAGKPETHIAVERVEEPRWAGFCVRDNGVGFPMEQVDRLFIPFSRLHGKKEFEGTGIGLGTVRRIAERHGGRVRAEGTPGQGAAFWFYLPKTP